MIPLTLIACQLDKLRDIKNASTLETMLVARIFPIMRVYRH